jgi:hypothetical protein
MSIITDLALSGSDDEAPPARGDGLRMHGPGHRGFGSREQRGGLHDRQAKQAAAAAAAAAALPCVCLSVDKKKERERGAKELAAAGLLPLYWAPNGRRPRPITTKPKPYGPTDSSPFPNPDWTARRRQEKKKEGSTAAAAASFRRRL